MHIHVHVFEIQYAMLTNIRPYTCTNRQKLLIPFNINQLLHCIGFYSRAQIRVNKSKYREITVLLYTCDI